MFKLNGIVIFIATVLCCTNAFAQTPAPSHSGDSTLEALQQIPTKYISTIDKKIDKYTSRVSSKTIKTLTKLSRWETKIKSTLQKVNPEAAARLFGTSSPLGRPGGASQLTFASLLQKIQQGQQIQLDYRRQYDKYRDDMTTGIQYLEKNKAFLDSGLAKKINAAKQKLQQLNQDEDSTEAIQQFIKERKQQLIKTAFQYLGNNKYLRKINAESFYHFETLKNYREIFSDEAKTEKLVKDVLNKVPGFQNFVQKNSMLASLFGSPGGDNSSPLGSLGGAAGLQTRASVQSMIQQRIAAGGAGAQEVFKQNMKQAQAQLNAIKDKLIKNPFAGNGGGELPDFKPNMEKVKTLKQRLIYETNIQFAKNNSLMPTTMDVALTVGYKLNDKSVAGIGAGWKAGLGSIDKIRFSSEGINLRSYLDWKIPSPFGGSRKGNERSSRGGFFISGGWEMNYLSKPRGAAQVSPFGGDLEGAWQQSALLGISKKINVKTKLAKQTRLSLQYDFFAKKNFSQQWVFRVGYSL